MDGATELVEGFLKNLLMNSNTSKINLIPTNGSKSFFKIDKIFTGPSDFHKLALSIFKATFAKSKPDEIVFRNYRKFNENNFNVDLRNQLSSEQPKDYTSQTMHCMLQRQESYYEKFVFRKIVFKKRTLSSF